MRTFAQDRLRRAFAHRLGQGIGTAVLALALHTGPAVAEDGAVDSVLKALDLKADPGEPADFVRQSRPDAEGDYLPVGARHPERPVKVKTPAELKAMEAGLEAARSRQDRIAGRKPPPEPSRAPKKPVASDKPAAAPPTQN